jgi:hypothetical protein
VEPPRVRRGDRGSELELEVLQGELDAEDGVAQIAVEVMSTHQ